ncbi:TM2 domain-containing protein CG10795-like [Branchiostoma lanceolatum]|uniref:TM2 domain-containing protein CG10795-like n=1 Tax=Branchiostoma lanceolatum TaxID=7740 RepID=UPI00345295B8
MAAWWRKNRDFLQFLVVFVIICLFQVSAQGVDEAVKCEDLRRGQYHCPQPAIDQDTQAALGCRKEGLVTVWCSAAPGINCTGDLKKDVPCRYTNGYHYDIALLTSIFLGMLGVDRFYLGYPAIGLLKLCTLGFMFLGQLVDIILIATQVVGPSDGSKYVINYYGPGLAHIYMDNHTYLKPQEDWTLS